MAEQREVVDGHDERGARPERCTERRAVEDVHPAGSAAEAERVPERVAADRREPAGAARREADELELRTAPQRREQPRDVARRPRSGLDERRRVDPDLHDAAARRTASRVSG